MKCEWKKCTLSDIIDFNPIERLSKGTVSKKISMEKLQTFSRSISSYELSEYKGGTKFRNGDTIMARITPCLENGKTAQVNILDENEIGFGSTEFIVMRAKPNISDKNYIYYLSISPLVREIAIKSMVGSSGRQRVQQDVLSNTEILVPPLETQQKIASILSALDDKIELNNAINKNLLEQTIALFNEIISQYKKNGCLGDYCSVKSGYAFKSSWWQEIGVKVIKIGSINQDNLDLNNCSYVSQDKITFANEFKVKGGDLLIAMTGATIGKWSVII